MHQAAIEVFATVKGISAASGLFLKGKSLYVIGDNSNYLYEYNIARKQLDKIQLLANFPQLDQIPKADKPDFEVLCHNEKMLYVLGSGSTAKRNRMVSYHLEHQTTIEYDLSPVFLAMKKAHAIDDENFNIEGAIFTGTQWLLFNRGNGSVSKNGIFIVTGADLASAKNADFVAFPLQATEGIASFTDAILYQNQIYFIAAAEDTRSTYDDGKILGSYIGSLDMSTLKLNHIMKISNHQKFEGITFSHKHASGLEFLLCEDTDTDSDETIIYKYLFKTS